MNFLRDQEIAQNESPETPKIFESLKTLKFVCQALKDLTSKI